jgi:hypothetical protein
MATSHAPKDALTPAVSEALAAGAAFFALRVEADGALASPLAIDVPEGSGNTFLLGPVLRK